jgi:hypothetical protein
VAARLSDGEVLSGRHGNTLPSVMKSVAELAVYLAGVVVVKSSERHTVVQKDAAICHFRAAF